MPNNYKNRRNRHADLAADPPPDERRRDTLYYIQNKGHQAKFPTESAHHVGRSGISAAVFADILLSDPVGDNQGRGQAPP